MSQAEVNEALRGYANVLKLSMRDAQLSSKKCGLHCGPQRSVKEPLCRSTAAAGAGGGRVRVKAVCKIIEKTLGSCIAQGDALRIAAICGNAADGRNALSAHEDISR